MSFLFWLFFVIFLVMDVVVGLYAAILLGFGPPSLRHALHMLVNRDDFARFDHWLYRLRHLREMIQKLLGRFRSGTEEEAAAEAEAPPENLDEMIEALAGADLADLLADETDEVMQVAPMQELFDDNLVSVLMDQGTEAWLMNEKNIETSILRLNTVMMKSGKFSADLDERLRSVGDDVDAALVRQYLQEMKDDYSSYLENQAAISERIKKRADEFGELKHLVEEIEYANMEQASQIETTLSNLDQIALRGTPEEGVTRMVKELATLRIARHRLRDMQDRAFLEMARYEKRVETISPQLYVDETTGLRNRIGLDVALYDWWRQGRQEKRKLTFALIDFVKFGELNLEAGIIPCDRLIRTVGRMLEKAFDPLDLVGLYTGGCFFVSTVNMGPRKTMTEIDRIRQQIVKTVFTYNTSDRNQDKPLGLRTALTCAAMEVPATLPDTEVLAILENTLLAAKKVGRNHTFIYDPNVLTPKPELLDAPDFGVQETTVPLE